jgi:hypothetical protein
MWSPLEKAVQGIIEVSTRGFFHQHEGFFQFSMLNLDQIMDVIWRAEPLIVIMRARKSRLLVVRR